MWKSRYNEFNEKYKSLIDDLNKDKTIIKKEKSNMETKINIEIILSEDKKIELTKEEAEKLYNELNKIFGNKRDVYPFAIPYPYSYYPYYPTITWTTSEAGDSGGTSCGGTC